MNKYKFFHQLPKLLVILVIFDLIQALCIGSVWYISDIQAQRVMSAKLGIAPGWHGLEEYIESHFEVGMTRGEILKQAKEVGFVNINVFFIGETYCEVYSFHVGPYNSARGGRWSICYDEKENVIRMERVLSQ
jgi:hypothetical protein